MSQKKTEIGFKFEAVKEIPTRTFDKTSKYDGILDGFLKFKGAMAKVTVPEIEVNYLRTQLDKRIKKRGLKVKVSTSNKDVYLEKEVVVELHA